MANVVEHSTQCNAIHRTIAEHFKVAIVYGKSVKHQPQRVGLSHELCDEDIGTYLCLSFHVLAWSGRNTPHPRRFSSNATCHLDASLTVVPCSHNCETMIDH